jgi:hypothetical protein
MRRHEQGNAIYGAAFHQLSNVFSGDEIHGCILSDERWSKECALGV